MTQSKETNPKDSVGETRVPLHLIPDSALAEEAMAFLEGAQKYGAYNWRVAGVRTSIYVSAARRHLSKFWNGQDRDPATLVHELASVRACCGILIDALTQGNLKDDRPPRADQMGHYAELQKTIDHLRGMVADKKPPYTEMEHGAQLTEEAIEKAAEVIGAALEETLTYHGIPLVMESRLDAPEAGPVVWSARCPRCFCLPTEDHRPYCNG
jgi:hypothetical protein